MAQTGFVLSDEGRAITVTNDSGTTAIEAGDICFSIVNDNVLTQTAVSARNAYSAGDIKVKSMTDSASGFDTVMGIALEDIPADGVGTIALDGVFIHQCNSNTEAGQVLQGDEAAANKVDVLAIATTTVDVNTIQRKIGRALTGATADNEFIVWKLTL